MKPSSRMTYALKALVDLALHQASGPVTVGTIAKRQEIPVRYLEQLFNRLRRRGIVLAERGPRGGYRLGRPASQIPVSSIFKSLESSLEISPSDPTASIWREVEQAVQTTLEATTLETLMNQVREQLPSALNHRFTFHI